MISTCHPCELTFKQTQIPDLNLVCSSWPIIWHRDCSSAQARPLGLILGGGGDPRSTSLPCSSLGALTFLCGPTSPPQHLANGLGTFTCCPC